MIHAELVTRAVRWLRNSGRACDPRPTNPEYVRRFGCSVVLTELTSSNPETPDAIGWTDAGGLSCLIECKTSRADFIRDKDKYFRKCPKQGVGRFRYLMTEPGLLRPDDIHELWGLLEVRPRTVQVAKLARPFPEWNREGEFRMMFSGLRKLQMGAVDETT